MRRISRAFFTGLAAVLPILITVYLLLWAAGLAESVFSPPLRRVLPNSYRPGMGVAVGLVLILLLGLVLQAWIARALFGWGERLLHRMPVVAVVYGAARDLIRFFSDPNRKSFTRVVLVTMGDTNFRQIGFVTREDFRGCPEGFGGADVVAVFLPNSFETGGVTALVPRSAVQFVDMPFHEALRFALTAGLSVGTKE
jgi:uncharacterized membrane protein